MAAAAAGSVLLGLLLALLITLGLVLPQQMSWNCSSQGE